MLQLGTDFGFISFFFKRWVWCLQVPSQIAEGFVCIIRNAVYMGSPGRRDIVF